MVSTNLEKQIYEIKVICANILCKKCQICHFFRLFLAHPAKKLYFCTRNWRPDGGMVDATDSKSVVREDMWVRVPLGVRRSESSFEGSDFFLCARRRTLARALEIWCTPNSILVYTNWEFSVHLMKTLSKVGKAVPLFVLLKQKNSHGSASR